MKELIERLHHEMLLLNNNIQRAKELGQLERLTVKATPG